MAPIVGRHVRTNQEFAARLGPVRTTDLVLHSDCRSPEQLVATILSRSTFDGETGQHNNLARSTGQRKEMREWALQDAKNRFSAVVDAAVAGDPQRVTRRGKPAVVVLAVDEYDRLRHLEKANAPTFADLLLAIPRDDGEFERLPLSPRPVDL